MILSPRRIRAVARKEMRHIFRDHRMRPVIFVVPIVQLVILGLAANLDVTDVDLLVVDQDQTPITRDITGRLAASTAFELVGVTADERDGERALDEGSAELVVVFPHGVARDLSRGEPVELPVWVDGTDTNRGLLAQSYLEQILGRVNGERMSAVPIELPGRPEARVRVLYNPTLKSQWFMLPAIVVMVLAVITMLLSAMAVVKEREKGTIEQLVVTPIRPAELILGKLLPFVGIGFVVATLVTVAAVGVFGVPFRGNPLELAVMAALFLMSTLGFGLLASTVSSTQQQAMLSAILVLLPSFLLGGVFYPISNMPIWAQRIADLTPIRYFVVMVRGVFLKGAGLEVMWFESAALAAIGVIVLAVAVLRFRKRSA